MTIEWMSSFLIFATFLCKNEEKNKLSVCFTTSQIDFSSHPVSLSAC